MLLENRHVPLFNMNGKFKLILKDSVYFPGKMNDCFQNTGDVLTYGNYACNVNDCRKRHVS